MSQLVGESEDYLMAAWGSADEEAERNEARAVFRIGFTVSIEGKTMESALSFGIRHRLSIESDLVDPRQAEMPLGSIAGVAKIRRKS